jgi:hypothetical protein
MKRVGMVVVLLLGLGGCKDEPPAASGEGLRPDHESADAIPASPVQGTIRGRAFQARDARLSVDARQGYEQVDIALSAASSGTPCGKLDDPTAPRIWLRRRGAQPVAAGDVRLRPGADQGWELHYQLMQDGVWVGNGDAAATIRLHPADGGAGLVGQLSACFADGMRSCVAGRFEALRCPVAIDLPLRGTEPPEQLPLDAGQEAGR